MVCLWSLRERLGPVVLHQAFLRRRSPIAWPFQAHRLLPGRNEQTSKETPKTYKQHPEPLKPGNRLSVPFVSQFSMSKFFILNSGAFIS